MQSEGPGACRSESNTRTYVQRVFQIAFLATASEINLRISSIEPVMQFRDMTCLSSARLLSEYHLIAKPVLGAVFFEPPGEFGPHPGC
jgi:hypothetical protein